MLNVVPLWQLCIIKCSIYKKGCFVSYIFSALEYFLCIKAETLVCPSNSRKTHIQSKLVDVSNNFILTLKGLQKYKS